MLRRRAPWGGWQEVTAGQFRAEVTALARGIIGAGIEPGDRVGLMSRTRYEWTLIDYAIWAAGAVTVPVYETSSAGQVGWILADSAARAVFAETGRHEQIISGVRGSLPGLEHVWMIDALDVLASGGAHIGGEQLDQRRAARTAADLATIVYTSGTTGRPKGCQLTHGNLLADAAQRGGRATGDLPVPGASTLLFLPLAHAFARIIQVGVLEAGVILGHWPEIATLAEGWPSSGPTFLLAVPRVFEKAYHSAQRQASGTGHGQDLRRRRTGGDRLEQGRGDAAAGRRARCLRLRHALSGRLVYAKVRAAVGGKVQYAVCGGAPLSERLGHFFRGAGITVLEGYGLTETTAAVTVNRPGRNKIGTVGLPLPGVSIRIADDGEILVKGPNVFPGYWRDDAATRQVLDPDGWLHTGDLGTLDDEGFLRITGRQKDLIVTAGGTNVAPAVLEDRVRAHPLVSQCMVVGEGRPYIACLVTLDPETLELWKRQHRRPAGATPSDLATDPQLIKEIQLAVDEANKAVSRAESIRRFGILGSDFTEASGQLTPSAKVRRKVVAKDFAADIDALYSPAR